MRIRTIKPEFWCHPVMGRASDVAKLMAIGLLNIADDEGFFYLDEILIRNAVRPFDDSSLITHGALTELSLMGYYEARIHPKHGRIGWIDSFKRHQVINRPSKNSMRELWDASNTHGALTELAVSAHTGREGKGREGKGTGNGREYPLTPKGDFELYDDEGNDLGVSEKPAYPETVKTIWEMFPAASRNRSSLAKLARAMASLRPKPSTGDLVAAIGQWQTSREWQTEGGKYVSGVHSWIADRKWETPPAQIANAQKSKHAGTTSMVITGEEF